jgi:integrase
VEKPQARATMAQHARQYAFPVLATKSVPDIATHDVLKVLSPIWLTKPETARRVRQRIGTVMDWSKAAGFRSGDNPIDAVTRGLPKQPAPNRHHEALPFRDVPAFVKRLRASAAGARARLAFEFLVQTATRTSETLLATWSEISEQELVWTIPAERMKAKRPHRVPLTERTLQILSEARRLADGPFVFPAGNAPGARILSAGVSNFGDSYGKNLRSIHAPAH